MIVKTILMDMEFVKTIDELMVQTVVNTFVAKKHIAEIERCIHTVKESSSDVLITPPFRYLHKLIVTDIVYFEVLWINFSPAKNGFYTKYSPRAIMAHTNLIWKKHCKVVFETYCGVHDKTEPIKLMVPQMHAAIELGPPGNIQVNQKFFWLNTGIILNRRNFIFYYIPVRVIKNINKWGGNKTREVCRSWLEFRNFTKWKIWGTTSTIWMGF